MLSLMAMASLQPLASFVYPTVLFTSTAPLHLSSFLQF